MPPRSPPPRLRRISASGIERNVGTGHGEHLSNSLADATSGPCDEDDFPRDIEFGRHHEVFSGIVALWCGLLIIERVTVEEQRDAFS
jgi:hypothetical protein